MVLQWAIRDLRAGLDASRPHAPSRETLRYVFANVFHSASKYLQVLVLPFVVSPGVFGEFSLVLVVIGYALNINLGLFNALPQYLPALDRESKGRAVLLRIATFNLFVTCASCCAALLLWLGGHSHLAAYTLLFLTNFYFNYLVQVKRGFVDFESLSVLKIAMAVGNLAVCGALLWRGYQWFLAAGVVFGLAVVMASAGRERGAMFGFWGRMDWRFGRQLLAIGFPIMVLGLIGALQQSVDRVVLGFFRSINEVGFYSIGGVLLTAVMLIPGSLFDLHYARLARLGTRGEGAEMRRVFQRQVLQTMLIGSALVLLGMLFVPPVIRHLLPGYAQGIPVLWILLPTSWFLLMGANYSNLFTATRQSQLSVVSTIIATGLSVVVNMYVLSRGGGLVPVATTMCVAAVVFVALQIWMHRHRYRYPDQYVATRASS